MSTVTGFNQLLLMMEQADFFTGILPFLLTYIVTFLALQKVPIINDRADSNQKKYSALIAIIVAFFVANFLVQNPTYQMFFSEYLGTIAIGLIGLLGFMLLLALVGLDTSNIQKPFMGVVLIFLGVAAFTGSGGLYAFIPESQIPLIGASLQEMVAYVMESGLIWLILIGAALYWVTKEPKDKEKEHWMKYWFGAPSPYRNNDGGNP